MQPHSITLYWFKSLIPMKLSYSAPPPQLWYRPRPSHRSERQQCHMEHSEELKLTCCPYSIPVNSLAVGEQCALCAVALVEAYHFNPTCRYWPAHEPQNKTLSVFSFVEVCPVCVWPGRGLSYLTKVDPCLFTSVLSGISPFISEEEASSKFNFPCKQISR